MDTLLCNDDGDIVLSVYDGLLTESSTDTHGFGYNTLEVLHMVHFSVTMLPMV